NCARSSEKCHLSFVRFSYSRKQNSRSITRSAVVWRHARGLAVAIIPQISSMYQGTAATHSDLNGMHLGAAPMHNDALLVVENQFATPPWRDWHPSIRM